MKTQTKQSKTTTKTAKPKKVNDNCQGTDAVVKCNGLDAAETKQENDIAIGENKQRTNIPGIKHE